MVLMYSIIEQTREDHHFEEHEVEVMRENEQIVVLNLMLDEFHKATLKRRLSCHLQ